VTGADALVIDGNISSRITRGAAVKWAPRVDNSVFVGEDGLKIGDGCLLLYVMNGIGAKNAMNNGWENFFTAFIDDFHTPPIF
jgi:hypothetical protein